MRVLSTLIAAAACALLGSCTPNGTAVEISFGYTPQKTHGSNQYAVWIENADGELVRTLFVTGYTVKGRARGDEAPVRGYIVRPACVPSWQRAAVPDNLSDAQLDSFSGATPQQEGIQTFIWDLTDADGNPVPDGEYSLFMEANFQDDNQVLYTGSFSVPQAPGEIEVSATYTDPQNTEFHGMIGSFSAAVIDREL